MGSALFRKLRLAKAAIAAGPGFSLFAKVAKNGVGLAVGDAHSWLATLFTGFARRDAWCCLCCGKSRLQRAAPFFQSVQSRLHGLQACPLGNFVEDFENV